MSTKSDFNEFMDEYYPEITGEDRHQIKKDAILVNDPKSKVVLKDRDKKIIEAYDQWFEKKYAAMKRV